MRVLVTGHRGYVGSLLVPALLQARHHVRGYDSGLFAACALSPLTAVPALDKDLRAVQRGDLEGFDAVIHLAGLSNDPLGALCPEVTYAVNHQASLRLAELAKRAGVARFLYASSCSVYGAAGDAWLDELSEKAPVTAYARSKLMVEQDLARLADAGFAPVFLRAGTAYGWSPMIRFDLVLNNLTAWAASHGVIPLKSDGSAWRPVVHVADIAAAYVALLEAPQGAVSCQAFNVGSTAENYRVRALADVVQEGFPDCPIELAAEATADVRCYRVNCDKLARTLPQFRTLWTAPRGVAELRDALQGAEVDARDFEGPRFQRVAYLKRLLAEGRIDETLRWHAPAVA